MSALPIQNFSTQHFTVTCLDGALGGEIHDLDLSRGITPELAQQLRSAFQQYQLLVIRGQALSNDQLLSLGRVFGELDVYPFAESLTAYPNIVSVVKLPETKLNFGGVWHVDSPYMERPPKATMLYGVDIPPSGGDTLFANQYAAYDALSAGFKSMLDGIDGVFCACCVHGDGTEDLKLGDVVRIRDSVRANLENLHPIVRTHPETGRKALFVSRVHVQRLHNMTDAESAPILDYLAAHATRPEFTARVKWEKGTVVVVDNRCAQHLALNDYPGHRREIYRIVIRDEQRPA